MKKWLIVLLGVILVALAGCGSSDKASENAGTKKVLKIGTNPDFAPFEYLDEKGKMTGFDIELALALGKEMGREVEMVNMAFDGLVPALQTGNLDLAMSGMTITEDRKKSIAFSDPYYQSGLVIVVKKENNAIQGLEDLKGKKVSAQIGTTGSLMASTIEGAKAVDFNHTPETFMEVKSGGVDAAINDLPVVQYFLKTEEGKDFKQVGPLLKTEYVGIGIDPTQKELAKEVNAALGRLKANGEYEKLYVKWFGVKPE